MNIQRDPLAYTRLDHEGLPCLVQQMDPATSEFYIYVRWFDGRVEAVLTAWLPDFLPRYFTVDGDEKSQRAWYVQAEIALSGFYFQMKSADFAEDQAARFFAPESPIEGPTSAQNAQGSPTGRRMNLTRHRAQK